MQKLYRTKRTRLHASDGQNIAIEVRCSQSDMNTLDTDHTEIDREVQCDRIVQHYTLKCKQVNIISETLLVDALSKETCHYIYSLTPTCYRLQFPCYSNTISFKLFTGIPMYFESWEVIIRFLFTHHNLLGMRRYYEQYDHFKQYLYILLYTAVYRLYTYVSYILYYSLYVHISSTYR